MIEVDNFGIVIHTHLILLHAYKQIFITKFLTKFRKTKFGKIVFGKTSFWKNRFCLEKGFFYQNKVQIFLVLIYDHNLVLISPRTLFCIYPIQRIFIKNFYLQKAFFKIYVWPSPVDRTVDRWQS